MKKKIFIIVSIIIVLALAVRCAYLIDQKRMANNKPVIFSTWGAQYVPPVEREDITNKIPNMPEVNKIASIQAKENETIFIELSEDWKYEVSGDETDRYEYAIKFYTSDAKHRMTLYLYKEMFGVCGTGLEIKDITLENGNIASAGFYDGSEQWSFVNFGDNLVMKNEGLTLEESTEALSIIKTIKFIKTFPGNITSTQRSFIATIIEEEPTYLIVEPKDGEIEKLQSNTKKILIANGKNRDYLYGVGRKVIINYDFLIQSDTNTITGAEIDVDGYDNFEFEVIKAEKNEKRKILNNKDLDKLNSNYDLYYYGLKEVNVKVIGKEMTLEKALREGYLTLSGILTKANKDINARKSKEDYLEKDYIFKTEPYPYEVRLKDGGSVEFHYENFVIIKCNTLDGNNAMYICKAGTTINDLNSI